ncbi:MAG: sulfurtransferase TusA family protein [Candidatus Kaistia colombiensis]|nr:MAG: sulfurtransferase TusA family protein [Kaistia sp.]
MIDEAERGRRDDADPGAGTGSADRVLDARGLACPLPVLKARKHLAGMAAGGRLLVEATDPMAAIDIPHLCQEDGHFLVRQERYDEAGRTILRFVIERGARLS